MVEKIINNNIMLLNTIRGFVDSTEGIEAIEQAIQDNQDLLRYVTKLEEMHEEVIKFIEK
jgi:hypothetical protein